MDFLYSLYCLFATKEYFLCWALNECRFKAFLQWLHFIDLIFYTYSLTVPYFTSRNWKHFYSLWLDWSLNRCFPQFSVTFFRVSFSNMRTVRAVFIDAR